MHPQQKYCFIVSWLLLALALLLFFTRCSPVQRLERMQKRHPYLFNKANDTIHYTDTVHISIPGTKVDTVIHENNIIDTITITKDNLIVQLWKVNDSIYVAGKTDTIYQKNIREIKVPYTKYVADTPKKTVFEKIGSFFFSLLIILAIIAGVFLLWKLYNWFKSKTTL